MQSFDSRHTFPPQFAAGAAANQDYLQPKRPVATVSLSNSVSSGGAQGWDPYEVWRRMVKEPRERRLTQDA